jgi:biotin transport system permease protein
MAQQHDSVDLVGDETDEYFSKAVLLTALTAAFVPVIVGVALDPPWFRGEPGLQSLRAVARIPPVLAVSAVSLATTPVHDARVAIERLVPGRAGQLLGVSAGLVVRFFPLVVDDLRAIRTAIHTRGGETRPATDRARRLAV